MCEFYVIVDNIMERFRTLNAVDINIFKACYITLGLIIGAYTSCKVKRFTPHLLLLFVVAYLYIVIKLVKADVDDLDWD